MEATWQPPKALEKASQDSGSPATKDSEAVPVNSALPQVLGWLILGYLTFELYDKGRGFWRILVESARTAQDIPEAVQNKLYQAAGILAAIVLFGLIAAIASIRRSSLARVLSIVFGSLLVLLGGGFVVYMFFFVGPVTVENKMEVFTARASGFLWFAWGLTVIILAALPRFKAACRK